MTIMRTRLSVSCLIIAISGTALAVAQGCGSAADGSSFHRSAANGDGGNGFNGGPTFGGDNGADGGGPCVGLQCQQAQCSNGGHTTVSGTVYDPAGKNPLYNVVVYVPNSKPEAFTDHASCDKCSALYTGSPIVTALTGPDGKFTLKDVPAGANIPLVIQIGKWRRQITLPTVSQCTDNPITDKSLTRLPANRNEGDLPKFAISTGGADTMECLFRRIGVDASEFAGGAGGNGERIHIFQGVGGNAASGSTPPETTLWDSSATLSKYDIVVLSCEGDEHPETKPATALQALQDYANTGGRVFASHFHYYWFEQGPAPFPATATWTTGSNNIGDISGAIDQSFPKGIAFDQWMKNVNALQGNGTVAIQQARHNANVDPNVNKGSRPWITNANPAEPATEYFTFNTPLGAAEDAQCGRVVYSDLHVGAASNDYRKGTGVPSGCTIQDLSPQEKALEFMLFDLSSCVTPDDQPPAPPPPTIR
jgi:hypothetical protein